ncbi:MAG: beta-propeller domain-containing protein [Opitutaceae bacterium]|jgi:hypothetical protein|nr:beta-propeller domain-containing protein [Opitutaceae bacterium]
MALWLWLVVLIGLLGMAPEGLAETRVLALQINQNRAMGVVNLPKGTTTYTLQSSSKGGVWTDVETQAARPGRRVFRLPADWQRKRFRVVVSIDQPSRTKFPQAFYRGANSFQPSRIAGANDPVIGTRERALAAQMVAMSTEVVPDSAPQAQPVEADIWKISGSTAYFFNQLRGLQVIDLTRPEDPALIAALRLPAVGQDLYLLPSGEGYQDVLLIATDARRDGANPASRLLVVRVEDGTARIVHEAGLEGSVADSRMLGRRLFLCATQGAGTTVSDWWIPEDAAPAKGAEVALAGGFGTLAAGADWIAVAMSPRNDWSRSEVSAFRLRPDGLEALTAAPVAIGGRINDAYKLQWSDGVLTTIAQRWDWGEVRGPVTRLETFEANGPDAPGTRLGELELARGETLHATRFAGDKAYIVTFFQKDPLFVIDLADPAAPRVAGQLDVPGWSTHLVPVGDLLFAVGWEDGAVTASLFDVSAPDAPTVVSRLALTVGHGYSEANWDPQAMQVLPEAGLALVPVNAYRWGESSTEQGVRLIDLDLAAREIRLRGLIPGRFEARRSALVGENVVTLSQRTLVSAAIGDRDMPEVLSDRLLAWPVNQAHAAGERLLQVEMGGAWAEGLPTVRTSPLQAPDALTAELDLPAGVVHDTALRDGRLYVLRENSTVVESRRLALYWTPPIGLLHLDIYDAAEPDALRLLGTCAVDIGKRGVNRVGRLLWPRSNRPVVVLETVAYGWWGRPYPIEILIPEILPVLTRVDPAEPATESATARAITAMPAIAYDAYLPYWREPLGTKPQLLAFDVADATAPKVGEPTPLFYGNATTTALKAAANGLLVIGADEWRDVAADKTAKKRRGLHHYLQIVDVPASGQPVARPVIDLPGELIAVSTPEPQGFLAYSRSGSAGGKERFHVNACDGRDAFLVASVDVPSAGVATATDRTLVCAVPEGYARFRLTDAGRLESGVATRLGWTPSKLRIAADHVLAADWKSLAITPLTGAVQSRTAVLPFGFDVERIEPAQAGGWVVPCGDYGVEWLPAPTPAPAPAPGPGPAFAPAR